MIDKDACHTYKQDQVSEIGKDQLINKDMLMLEYVGFGDWDSQPSTLVDIAADQCKIPGKICLN